MSEPQHGPVYGVELFERLPISHSTMIQACPSRSELERVHDQASARTVAAYEILTDHFREALALLKRSLDRDSSNPEASHWTTCDAREFVQRFERI